MKVEGFCKVIFFSLVYDPVSPLEWPSLGLLDSRVLGISSNLSMEVLPWFLFFFFSWYVYGVLKFAVFPSTAGSLVLHFPGPRVSA